VAGIPRNRGEGKRGLEGFIPRLPGGGRVGFLQGIINLNEMNQNSIPKNIESWVIQASPNEPILIYTGLFTIKNSATSVELEGKIVFKWLPEMRPEFIGNCQLPSTSPLDSIDLLGQDNAAELLIDGALFGKCFVTKIQTGTNLDYAIIKGVLPGRALLNDTSVPVTSIKFSVANLRNLNGAVTKTVSGEDEIFSNNRFVFSLHDYIITLDKSNKFKNDFDSLQSDGGYYILYAGEISSVKGNIKLIDIDDLIHCFSIFITFLNGRRCSLLFLTGFFDEQPIWQDFTPRFTDQYQYVPSWVPLQNIAGINDTWQCFHALWQDKNNQSFIKSAVHWYVEANSHAAFTEGSIVLTQTALELLYNWLIIENKGLITGKDAESISAANKIRLLLNALDIPYKVPSSLPSLSKLVSDNKDITDGPDSFVLIRNAIVHSQENKRKRLMEISVKAKYEALTLGLWYLELALLYSFKFEGRYRSRVSASKWAGSDEENVPWMNK
jgi:hypothetical protein